MPATTVNRYLPPFDDSRPFISQYEPPQRHASSSAMIQQNLNQLPASPMPTQSIVPTSHAVTVTEEPVPASIIITVPLKKTTLGCYKYWTLNTKRIATDIESLQNEDVELQNIENELNAKIAFAERWPASTTQLMALLIAATNGLQLGLNNYEGSPSATNVLNNSANGFTTGIASLLGIVSWSLKSMSDEAIQYRDYARNARNQLRR